METQTTSILLQVCYKQTFAPYLFIICQDYVLRTSIDVMKDFKMTKEGSRRYPAQKITGVDYADDIALLANTPLQAYTCYIVWNEQLGVYNFSSTHTRRNTRALIKEATSLH